MTNIHKRNTLKGLAAAGSFASSTKWVTPAIILQSLPSHAQATSNTTPLIIVPEFSLCSVFDSISNNSMMTPTGNPTLRFTVGQVLVDRITLNLLSGELPANEVLNVDIEGNYSIISVDGPSETDIVVPGFISGNHPNRNFNLGINDTSIATETVPTITPIFEQVFTLVAPASQGLTLTYRFDFFFKTTFNGPRFQGQMQAVTQSILVTIEHVGFAPTGIPLYSGSLPQCNP